MNADKELIVDGKKVAVVIFEDGDIKQVGAMNIGKCLIDASAALIETARSINIPFSVNGQEVETEPIQENKKEEVTRKRVKAQ
jgi:hypothetical protein